MFYIPASRQNTHKKCAECFHVPHHNSLKDVVTKMSFLRITKISTTITADGAISLHVDKRSPRSPSNLSPSFEKKSHHFFRPHMAALIFTSFEDFYRLSHFSRLFPPFSELFCPLVVLGCCRNCISWLWHRRRLLLKSTLESFSCFVGGGSYVGNAT